MGRQYAPRRVVRRGGGASGFEGRMTAARSARQVVEGDALPGFRAQAERFAVDPFVAAVEQGPVAPGRHLRAQAAEAVGGDPAVAEVAAVGAAGEQGGDEAPVRIGGPYDPFEGLPDGGADRGAARGRVPLDLDVDR